LIEKRVKIYQIARFKIYELLLTAGLFSEVINVFMQSWQKNNLGDIGQGTTDTVVYRIE